MKVQPEIKTRLPWAEQKGPVGELAICYNAAMAQLDEKPIIRKHGLFGKIYGSVFCLFISGVHIIISVPILIEGSLAGGIAVLCLGLVFWCLTVKWWYDAKQRLLLYSDRIVLERPRSRSTYTQVIAFSNIAEVDFVYVPGGVPSGTRYFKAYLRDGKEFQWDDPDPKELQYLLRDLLERYHTAHPP